MKLRCLKPTLAPAPSPRGWKPDDVRGTRQERGYGRAWEITRERILERDDRLCQPCAHIDRVSVATQVDHIVGKAIARSRGWTTEQIEADSNLQAICDACHKAKTARESHGPRGEG